MSEWIDILRLAQTWEFPTIIQVAFANLRNCRLDPITKLKIGEEYHYLGWVRDAWTELLGRQKSLSAEETEWLGIKRATKVAHAREALLTIRMRLQYRRNSAMWYARACDVAQKLFCYPEYAHLTEGDIVASIMDSVF